MLQGILPTRTLTAILLQLSRNARFAGNTHVNAPVRNAEKIRANAHAKYAGSSRVSANNQSLILARIAVTYLAHAHVHFAVNTLVNVYRRRQHHQRQKLLALM